MTRLRWIASVGCEGGPLLLADVRTFVGWKGALIEDRGQRTLHLWGQFTGELPERFRPGGATGHQYIELDSPEQARACMTELCDHVQATWPDAKVLRGEFQAQILRKDYKQLWAQLAPLSEYDAAVFRRGSVQAWTHRFGDAHEALLWDVHGGGVVELGVREDRRELVVQRFWVDEQEHEQLVRDLVDVPQDGEEEVENYQFGEDAVVAVWAQTGAQDLDEIDGTDADVMRALAGKDPAIELSSDSIGGLGTVIRLEPGRYTVAVGTHDDQEWACRWARLTWKGTDS